jgi:predicted RNase H-like HicB family nuclease
MTYTAIVKQVEEGWIGWVEEIPGVNCQEGSYEKLLETLAVTAREAIELNKEEALASAGQGYRELALTV